MQAFSQGFNVIFNNECRSMWSSSKQYSSLSLVSCLRAQFSPPKVSTHLATEHEWTHNAQGMSVQELVCCFCASLECNEGQVVVQLCHLVPLCSLSGILRSVVCTRQLISWELSTNYWSLSAFIKQSVFPSHMWMKKQCEIFRLNRGWSKPSCLLQVTRSHNWRS